MKRRFLAVFRRPSGLQAGRLVLMRGGQFSFPEQARGHQDYPRSFSMEPGEVCPSEETPGSPNLAFPFRK